MSASCLQSALTACVWLQMGTPPNLIVFSSERLQIVDMIRRGAVMSVVAVLLVTCGCYLLVPLVYGFSYGDFPSWAE